MNSQFRNERFAEQVGGVNAQDSINTIEGIQQLAQVNELNNPSTNETSHYPREIVWEHLTQAQTLQSSLTPQILAQLKEMTLAQCNEMVLAYLLPRSPAIRAAYTARVQKGAAPAPTPTIQRALAQCLIKPPGALRPEAVNLTTDSVSSQKRVASVDTDLNTKRETEPHSIPHGKRRKLNRYTTSGVFQMPSESEYEVALPSPSEDVWLLANFATSPAIEFTPAQQRRAAKKVSLTAAWFDEVGS